MSRPNARQRFTLNTYKSSIDITEKFAKKLTSQSAGDLASSKRVSTPILVTAAAQSELSNNHNGKLEKLTIVSSSKTSEKGIDQTNKPAAPESYPNMTLSHNETYHNDFNLLKLDLESFTKKASDYTIQFPLYDFLLSHCFKVQKFLESATASVGDNQKDLQRLTTIKDKTQISEVISVWTRLQEAFIDQYAHKEDLYKNLVSEFKAMEKKLFLLEEYLNEKTKDHKNVLNDHSEDRSREKSKNSTHSNPGNTIIFNQLSAGSKPSATMAITSKDLPAHSTKNEGSIIPKPEFTVRQLHQPISRSSRSMQTDSKVLINAETGPDDTIPTFKTKECQADLRHPIQDEHDQLLIDHQALKDLYEKLKQESEETVTYLTTKFEKELREAEQNLESERELRCKIATSSRIEKSKLQAELEKKSESNITLSINLDIASKTVLNLESNILKLNNERAEVEEERNHLFEKSNDLHSQLKVVNQKLVELDSEIQVLKVEKQNFQSENCQLKSKVEGFTESMAILSKNLLDAKEQTKEATLAKKNLLEQYYQELEMRKNLQAKNLKLEKSEVESAKAQDTMAKLVQDLQDMVAKLMQFPDLSVQEKFNINEPIRSPEWAEKVHHMVEHNNMRISLLEQRNNRYRELLLDHADTQGYESHNKYHPISAVTPLFNIDAIENAIAARKKIPRPESVESATTNINYVIGSVNKDIQRISRPATVKGKPLISKINGEFEIDFVEEEADTRYPPRFPLATPNSGQKDKKSRSEFRPKPSTAKSRPDTSVTFRWDSAVSGHI